uniref:Uncharacterized protein n=1 Tax=Panagrolaimus superbus TaxID=310955 RepID=A0A914YM05_9BILA
MLPTKNAVKECKIKAAERAPNMYIEFFSSELDSNEMEIYSDLTVLYQSTWSTSTFNVLVMVEEIYMLALSMLDPQIKFQDYDLCNEGSIMAYFQYLSDNNSSQTVAKMTAPVNFMDSRRTNYFWGETSICRTKMDQKNITEMAHLIPTTKHQNDVTMKPGEGINGINGTVWLIIGGTITIMLMLSMVIIGRILWNKFTSERRMSSVLKGKSDSFISVMKTKEEYWKMLLNVDNVIINFEEVIGEGSKAIVYKGKQHGREGG